MSQVELAATQTRRTNAKQGKESVPKNSADKSQVTTVNNTQIDKELKKEYQKNKSRFQQIEEKLAQLNKGKADLEALMASPDNYANKEKFHQTEASYKKLTGELATLNKEYEIVFEKVMELEEKMG